MGPAPGTEAHEDAAASSATSPGVPLFTTFDVVSERPRRYRFESKVAGARCRSRHGRRGHRPIG
jgi:hypothetical protein